VVDLKALYRETGSIPWVVGLSGGKDSTAVTMLLLETIESLPPPVRAKKKVFVTCVNTLVEAPPVIAHVHAFIARLQEYVRDRELPVEVVELQPESDQTFWVNLIGRGYPTPYREFRWCTDRMKVRPAQRFIEERPEVFGTPPSVHFLLGTRFDESAARQATMEANTNLGTDLHAHGTIPTAKVIRPIETWDTDDVWGHLLKEEWTRNGTNPFLDINQQLAVLYKDAASGECPVVFDASQQTCAGSRFGCWTCTVVDVDNSLREMIATGGDRYDGQSLGLLADFRDALIAERNLPENRVHGRSRQGKVLVKRDGTMGVGPYTMDYRANVLERVRALQEQTGEDLISAEEERHIQRIWLEEEANLARVMHSRLEEGA
jgi:DNA sulfur modification protein DndC